LGGCDIPHIVTLLRQMAHPELCGQRQSKMSRQIFSWLAMKLEKSSRST
jgi:hypothetical protein